MLSIYSNNTKDVMFYYLFIVTIQKMPFVFCYLFIVTIQKMPFVFCYIFIVTIQKMPFFFFFLQHVPKFKNYVRQKELGVWYSTA